MRLGSVFRAAVCVQGTVIEWVSWKGHRAVMYVRARLQDWYRWSRCQRRDRFCGRLSWGHRWPSTDVRTLVVYFLADTHRVECRDHGVVVAHAPRAPHGSRFTVAFQDLAWWPATQRNQMVAAAYPRTMWRWTGHVIEGGIGAGEWPVVTARVERIGVD